MATSASSRSTSRAEKRSGISSQRRHDVRTITFNCSPLCVVGASARRNSSAILTTRAAPDAHARIQVSEKASIAVEMVRPAMARGMGAIG